MISSKKGDGLSMNVIIIAILALLVLVVLTLIFVKQMDKTSTQTDAICLVTAAGARCAETNPDAATLKDANPDGKKRFTDCALPKKCWVPISTVLS